MFTAMATATFFRVPFPKTLEMIRRAGFEFIELDGYWFGPHGWETAQHIKGIPPRDVISMVKDSGLKISSFHDMGGVIGAGCDSVISPSTYEYLECADIPCLVFHVPHKMTDDPDWWKNYQKTALCDLQALSKTRQVLVENLTPFENYTTPLLFPEEMLAFVEAGDLHVNLDVTHAAQAGVDILHAADVLASRIKAVHLSDYLPEKMHLYMGEGNLPLKKFLEKLKSSNLHAITVECNIPYDEGNEAATIEKCKQAKAFVDDVFAV